MKEDFLHYVWRLKKFDHTNLQTTRGDKVTILHPGEYLQLAGPDFFNARLIIGNQKWAGNIEIHINASDWYLHHHQDDTAYENVILHVVWQYDADIYRINNTEIPVLELSHYVSPDALESYNSLLIPKSWIYCEKQLCDVPDFTILKWKESLFIERLERKAGPIMTLLSENGGDWEATLFCMLAKNFGLNTNGNCFFEVARSIPFRIVLKEQAVPENIEALIFGMAGMLQADHEDIYYTTLQNEFRYLTEKYNLHLPVIEPVQYFKHRPDNFPTIRLSQFSMLYSSRINLFSEVSSVNSVNELYDLFNVAASDYWKSHYLFDKPSRLSARRLARPFIDLLVINTVVPFQFAYTRSIGKQNYDRLFELLQQLKPERNAIVSKFEQHGLRVANAFDSQAMLQLKNEYCNCSRCLQCSIGIELLKS